MASLFGRAAFSATSADFGRWTGQPYDLAVGALVDIPAPAGRGPQADEARRIALERADPGLGLAEIQNSPPG